MLIYIVEDDAEIREMECYALHSSGFEVSGFGEGRELFPALARRLPDLILLDIMLPGEDGLSILKKVRAAADTRHTPVMMVTAKTTELDTVRGLDQGADDYITKPFGIMELVSRVKALLRRTAPLETPDCLIFAGIQLDDTSHTVTANGVPCTLTFKEYELLKLLLSNPGTVFNREVIMDKVWGFEYGGATRTVDMHIKTLRQKLGDCGDEIKTIRNVGYKLG